MIKTTIEVAADKSISHRAIIFASLALGTSIIDGLLESADVMATVNAMRALGVHIEKISKSWRVDGVTIAGLQAPSNVLDMGNSGTSARLIIGLLSVCPWNSFVTGDESLRKRPMARLFNPLKRFGAEFITSQGEEHLPVMIRGTDRPLPIDFELQEPSAQVKSAIILAALGTPGISQIIEHHASRDHSEIMLRSFGVSLTKTGNLIEIEGQQRLTATSFTIPSDPSSAAFFIVLALLLEDAEITIKNICINPLRTGLFTTLQAMGGRILYSNQRLQCGELVADIVASYSPDLIAIDIAATVAPTMIDEYLILSLAAMAAEGTTKMRGLGELRVKESNRFDGIINLAQSLGISAIASGDDIVITGDRDALLHGSNIIKIKAALDHRIAMTGVILKMIRRGGEVEIDDLSSIATSFPNFMDIVEQING